MRFFERGYTLEEALQSVGLGWQYLIRAAFEAKPEDVKIVQVKEKFGGLRIYTDKYNEIYSPFLESLLSQSTTICEWCGKPGSADNSNYWILTLCDEDKEKRRLSKENDANV